MSLIYFGENDVSERELLCSEIIEEFTEILENEFISILALCHHPFHPLNIT